MSPVSPFIAMALHFALVSFFAIGGVNVIIPEMHRQVVDVSGWITDRQFVDLYAIAQAAPGPNAIVVTLIGFQVFGIAGGLMATVAFCGPSCVLAYYIGKVWERFKEARWRMVVQAGVVPIGVGLMSASALVLAQTADHSATAVGLTLATAAYTLATRLHPLWMLALGGLVGFLGLV